MQRVHGVVPPMLAMEYRKAAGRLRFPLLAQPKLDGMRCLAVRGRDDVFLRSRSGEAVKLPHIADALRGLMAEGEEWDGELWAPGRGFDDVMTGVRQRADWLEYHVFDAVTADPFTVRHAALRVGGPVHRVPLWACPTPDAVDPLHERAVDEGFEGLILRTPDAPYRPNGGTPDLVKLKRFDDAEYPADDFTLPGDGSVVFHCRAVNGRPFRARLARAASALVDVSAGCLVKVRHLGLTIHGVPRQPVALGVRPLFDL